MAELISGALVIRIAGSVPAGSTACVGGLAFGVGVGGRPCGSGGSGTLLGPEETGRPFLGAGSRDRCVVWLGFLGAELVFVL